MEILEVSVIEYTEVIKTPYHVFNTTAFNDLNINKCDEVFYLLFREGKFRLGIIGGIKNKIFYSPFSAPFGSFSYISSDVRFQYIENALKLLKRWAVEKGFVSISLTLPPSIYGNSFIAKQCNCLFREGFEISDVNLNYSFDLDSFDDNYPESIWYNARKNLRKSMNNGLLFAMCTNNEEKKIAYDIILKNRKSRGYPLRMSWQQVSDTVQIINSDFFQVYNDKRTSVASAVVFHISDSIVQVVYWGDIQGYSEMKPMNFLSFKIFEYYKSSGKKIVDIGPSTENSVPNYGLCEFKESIGCRIEPKFTFFQKLD